MECGQDGERQLAEPLIQQDCEPVQVLGHSYPRLD
jgi:hypothetical protein